MAKIESSFKNMTIVLSIITGIAAIGLGFVYKLTLDPIAQVKIKELQNSINLVVPGADKGTINEFAVMPDEGNDSLYFYEVMIDDQREATAVLSYTDRGFSGRFTIMVGFDIEGNIIDNNILEHKETPGLGDKASKSKSNWNDQFKGLNLSETNLDVDQNVDAITAATITSRAYCDALERAHRAYIKHYNNEQTTANDAEQNIEEE